MFGDKDFFPTFAISKNENKKSDHEEANISDKVYMDYAAFEKHLKKLPNQRL